MTYSDELRAEALSLTLAHANYHEAARIMMERYGADAPDWTTIRRWVMTVEGFANTLHQKQIEASQQRWANIEIEGLNKLETEIATGKISGYPLNATTGTAADKRLRRQEIDKKPGDTNITIFQAIARGLERLPELESPDIIEAVVQQAMSPVLPGNVQAGSLPETTAPQLSANADKPKRTRHERAKDPKG